MESEGSWSRPRYPLLSQMNPLVLHILLSYFFEVNFDFRISIYEFIFLPFVLHSPPVYLSVCCVHCACHGAGAGSDSSGVIDMWHTAHARGSEVLCV
jgi:hypothetical protein